MDPCELTQARKIQARFVSKSFTMSICCFALLGLEETHTESDAKMKSLGEGGHKAPLHQSTPTGVRKALKVRH